MLQGFRRWLAPHRKKAAVGAAGIAAAAAVSVPMMLSSPGAVNVFVGSTPTPSDPCIGQGFTFCDEFNNASVDTAKWTVLNEHNDPTNSEPGCAKTGNVAEVGGYLTETIQAESTTCPTGVSPVSYTTGIVQFKTYAFTYGTVEVRAKFAGGTGSWPAIWMLGANCQSPTYLTADGHAPCAWPADGSQEIDIAEFVSGFSTVYMNLYTAGGNTSNTAAITDVSQNFHTYRLEWTPGQLVFKVDTVTKQTYTSNVPSTPMFLILQSTLGGNGGGTINPATLPGTAQFDYVHVTA